MQNKKARIQNDRNPSKKKGEFHHPPSPGDELGLHRARDQQRGPEKGLQDTKDKKIKEKHTLFVHEQRRGGHSALDDPFPSTRPLHITLIQEERRNRNGNRNSVQKREPARRKLSKKKPLLKLYELK